MTDKQARTDTFTCKLGTCNDVGQIYRTHTLSNIW